MLVTGKKFADDFTALIEAGPLDEGIAVTETGSAMYGGAVDDGAEPACDRGVV